MPIPEKDRRRAMDAGHAAACRARAEFRMRDAPDGHTLDFYVCFLIGLLQGALREIVKTGALRTGGSAGDIIESMKAEMEPKP